MRCSRHSRSRYKMQLSARPPISARHPGRSRRAHSVFTSATRRDLVLHSSLLPLAALPALDALLQPQGEPQSGNCPTCVGPVDGTLGSCSDLKTCVSSFDDRPGFFLEPWLHEERLQSKAQADLFDRVSTEPGVISVTQQQGYVYAQFSSPGGVDDVEFLFLPDDNVVQLRASARSSPLAAAFDATGAGRARLTSRFESLRIGLGWEIVPVLRNRVSSALGLGETPFDSFGPPPPTGVGLQELLEMMEPV